MDYSNYTVEDFISDESFQRYCHNQNEKDVRFWSNWKEDHPHRQYGIEEAENFVRSLQFRRSLKDFEYASRKQTIRAQLQKKISD